LDKATAVDQCGPINAGLPPACRRPRGGSAPRRAPCALESPALIYL